jgi:hypothetical protein
MAKLDKILKVVAETEDEIYQAYENLDNQGEELFS